MGVKLDVGDWRSRWYLHDGSCNLVRLRNGLLKKTSFIGRDFFFLINGNVRGYFFSTC